MSLVEEGLGRMP